MASGGRESKSKIPRYKFSKVPVCSLEQRKLNKGVKEKRLSIEVKSSEVEGLSAKLEDLKLPRQTATSSTEKPSPQTTKSSLRSLIVTPGGTKRKVNTSRSQFKVKLKSALDGVITIDQASEVSSADILQRLKRTINFSENENSKVLALVSEIYGVKQKQRGKQKRGYYPGLSLAPPTQSGIAVASTNTSEETSPLGLTTEMIEEEDETRSPIAKVARDQQLSTRCRAQLDFNTGTGTDELSVQGIGILPNSEHQSEEITSLRIENAELHDQIKVLEKKLLEMESVTGMLIEKQQEIIALHQEITETGNFLGGVLSLAERNAIKEEIKKAKKIYSFGMRDQGVDLAEIFDPNLFNKLRNDLKSECPTISNILEQLVLSPNASRNTIKTMSMKMKAAVHLLGSLLDVRDQHSKNDIPVLFGMLCLCYGAGPSMIHVLQTLGLSESFSSLTTILKRQLQNYKELLKKRAPDNRPVITYQDNMQIMRTSMRHLRLSKLQKEKLKQGKMWDFTVRGWRLANIDGLEELFSNKVTALDSQQDISKLEFKDICIENNEQHHHLWESFRSKTLLQKLDVCLNNISVSCSEIQNAGNDNLLAIAKTVEEPQVTKKFKIDIPPVQEDFPNLSKKQTKIYPLPISHENQCTILGTASNLDLFASEFGFSNERNNKKNFLTPNDKDFDLDKAYERYSFLKSYEMHKKTQKEYEATLRMQQDAFLNTTEYIPELDESDVLLHVFDDDTSSSEDEIN